LIYELIIDSIVLSNVKVDYEKVFLFLLLSLSTVAFLKEDAWVYFNAKSNYSRILIAFKDASERALERRIIKI
jgi:hypothetical protein